MVIRVEGTVEGFNQTAFAEHLANFLGVPVANVQLSVVPSSILVTATILVPSGASTNSVTSSSTTILERLRSLDSATASQILQVVVLSIAPPTITSTATDMNAATRAAFQEADASRRNTRIIGITAGGAAAASRRVPERGGEVASRSDAAAAAEAAAAADHAQRPRPSCSCFRSWGANMNRA